MIQQPTLFIGGMISLAAAILFFSWLFRKVGEQLKIDEADSKRTSELVRAAISKYPDHSLLKAAQHYLWDLEERIEVLRKNAIGTDVLYAIKSDLQDCTLLRQEISLLIGVDLENNSGFNILTPAQL